MMSDEKPTAQEMLPDPPTITLAPSVPISIAQVHPTHPAASSSNEPVTIAPFSQAAEQLNQQNLISEQQYQLNHEYLRKKYRRKYENPEKIKELYTEQQGVVANLQTAIEGKMDVAAIGVLSSIINSLDFANFAEPSSLKNTECGDRQRALFKAGICPMIATCLRELGGQVMVCSKALSAVAYLCRFSEENRQSVCLENCKGLGLAGVCELVVGAIKRHGDDRAVIEASCDAVRSLCALESNRDRLGNAGCCEALARCLTKYHLVADLCGWLCRAIGHLANNNDHNRLALGSAGAVQNVIITIQKFPASSAVCTEACWAVRQICPIEENRKRFFDDFGPESIMAVFKTHFALEHFAVEACRCVVNMVSSEEDPIIPRLANSGFIGYSLKALKRNPDSEILARWVFNALYYVACEEKSLLKLVTYDILDQLSVSLENHAGFEPLAEWGARITHKLYAAPNISGKMRSAGLCEMIPSCVQRQAISAMISSVGCQAIGDLATDFANQERLSAAGACEAVVGALKRHNESADVVYNTCYAIHFLSLTQNNVSWMGAYGACEAVTNALNKHCSSSVEVTINSVSALASLAHKDEGNQLRIHAAGGCEAVVTALRTHEKSADVTENACRAIYNLCGDNHNVKDLGLKGACGLVVASIQAHFDEPTVVTQSLLAIFALAVKVKGDKVHQGNTKKLVNKGAIEMVVAAMQKYAADEEVQRAAAMAITSLARLESNRNKLGAAGACDLVMKAMKTHITSSAVVTKMALAIDGLSSHSEGNKVKFIAAGAVDILLAAFQKHEKVAYLVADIFRALVTLCTVEESRAKIHAESSFKMYVKALRAHDKNVYVARWGSNMIYTAATDDHNRLKLGNAKACEAVVNVLSKHAAKSSEVSEWACRAIVGLAALEANKVRFVTHETCTAITTALQEHYKEPVVAEWATAAIASVAHTNLNRLKLGAAAVPLCNTFNENMSSNVISKLVCEAIFELCIEASNQDLFYKANVCDTLISALTNHASDAVLAMSICRAMANVSANHVDSSSKIGDLGGCELLVNCMVTHMYNAPLLQWSCAAITALSSKNTKNQTSFGSFGAIDTIAKGLVAHKTTDSVCAQTTRALRALTNNHTENQKAVATSTVIIPTLMQILKNHVMHQTIVEHTCWLLGTIEYKSARPGSVRVTSTSERATPSPTVQVVAASADTEGSSTDATSAAAGHTIKPKEFYSKPANWDLLFLALQSHVNHSNTGRWVCSAVSMFADHGKLPHGNMCDLLLTYLDKHIENDAAVQKILQAIGALARTNAENNNRLSRGHACEIIDQIMSGYSEGNPTIFGLLPAITGLADKNPANQNRFNAAPSLVKNVASVLYNELETDFISQWGCSAVAALARNNPGNQQKLSSVCSYIADVIGAHKGNLIIALETFRAISALSHTSITNRNRLGASDACQAVPEVLKENINTLISQPFHNIERSLLYWSARTIADLAANNPNNQSKLGANGACACLVRMLQKDSLPGELQQEVKFFTTVFWAIGNIVQLGKGPSMVIDDGGQALDGSDSVPASEKVPIGIAGTDMVLGGLNLIPGGSRKAKKNANRLMEAGVSDWTQVILLRYMDHASVVQWGCRAINNMSKSSKLRANLIEIGIHDVIQKVFERHADHSEVIEWAILARETLNGSTNVPL